MKQAVEIAWRRFVRTGAYEQYAIVSERYNQMLDERFQRRFGRSYR